MKSEKQQQKIQEKQINKFTTKTFAREEMMSVIIFII